MTRPIVARIDLAALSNNLRYVRQCAPSSRLWAVVKANAYGHGLRHLWATMSAQADGFALLNIEDGIWLRQAGWQGPVLLLEGFFDADELHACDQYGFTSAVHSDWQLALLEHARLSAPLAVYLKLNSGMNRLGFPPALARERLARLRAMPQVGEVTLMAHFADADKPEGVLAPLQRLAAGTHGLSEPRCYANSAAVLWHPQTHHQWVRPGIILYGASPSGNWQDIAASGLMPVMSLHSKIIAVQALRKGDTVGYTSRWQAPEERRIGIVAAGYADGFPRHAPDGTPVLVDGVKTAIVGTVSMDMLAIDLTPCPGAVPGSDVELWGKRLPVDDVAGAAGTVGYELLSALAPRVPIVVK